MYVGSNRFAVVRPWISGFDYALREIFPEHASPRRGGPADGDLDGFHEWLVMSLDGPPNIDWLGVVADKFGAEKEATDALFEMVDRFVEDLKARGLQAILQDHLEYEVRRYEGNAFTSRLATKENPTYGYWGEPVDPRTLKPYDAEAKRHLAWAGYYRSLSNNHTRTAHYPWLPLAPDPPPPEPERPC
jgi:hypothetical protein